MLHNYFTDKKGRSLASNELLKIQPLVRIAFIGLYRL